MTEDEKIMLAGHGFKDFRQDMEGNVIAWKKEIPKHEIEIYLMLNEEEESFDLSYKDLASKDETENRGKWKTLHNGIEDVESAIEVSNDWLTDQGYGDMDTVKPVFNADPQKIAEDIDELERSIDGDEYDAAFPDREAHIAELAQDIRNGNTEFLTEYLHAFTLQEAEAEKKMAEELLRRLAEYQAFRASVNINMVAAEMEEEENYNNLDGIIGNSAPKEHKRVHIKTMIEENRKRLGLSGDPQELAAQEEQRNRK